MRTLNSRYELLSIIGRGGMSTVYLARDMTLNKNWAVKEIAKEGACNNANATNSLLAEASLMKNLDHPALPRIVDIIEEPDRFYIVMDYVEGENLKDILKRSGPQGQNLVIRWGLEIADVLRYLHSLDPPIIYRDMKPANMILQPGGNLKLIDFGIARRYSIEKAEDTQPLGTHGYAAPEQFETEGRLARTDPRTDVYNLGMTMYELVTGKLPSEPPYVPVPIREVDRTLSAGLEKIIDRATRRNPGERFQNADELITALLNFEKFDEAYVAGQKKKLAKAVIPVAAGIVSLFLGAGLVTADSILSHHQYESLITDTGNPKSYAANLEEAIRTVPERPEGYELLIRCLSEDGALSEDESERITTAWVNAKNEINPESEEWLEINYILGENYLVYFTGSSDNSARNRLLFAYPFFREICETKNTDFHGYETACVYESLGRYYREYICTSGPFAKTADEKEIRKFLDDSRKAVRLSGGNDRLRLIIIKTVAEIARSQCSRFSGCISEKKLTDYADYLKNQAEETYVESEETGELKKETCASCEKLAQDMKRQIESERKMEND